MKDPVARQNNGPFQTSPIPHSAIRIPQSAIAMLRLLATLALLAAPSLFAEPAQPAIVSHIKVLSDKVPDVSSLEAWRASFITPGMTDEQKALAVWQSVAAFQYQDNPPSEFLQSGDLVADPIKGMNVYGYSFCSVASAHVQCLARFAGLKARGWTIHNHVVSEIEYDGAWRLLDSSLITYFPKADGKPASVEEIVAGVKEWSAQNPEIAKDEKKLREFMRGGGWKKGPDILTRCTFYDQNGWLPAATHGWYATMDEYSGKTLFQYEQGYGQGYQVNIQLREGERLTRNWSNQGLHINMEGKGKPDALTAKVGAGGLRYSPKFGDLANGRIGNGTHEYHVPLASGTFRGGALVAENLATTTDDQQTPALHAKDAGKPATYILRMPSSYVYLGGEAILKASVPQGSGIDVLFSDNHGLDWKPLTKITATGEQRLDLKPHVFRRYDYQLKFVLTGQGAGLDALKISHPIQHSQRPLPALAAGENKITFSADNEGTITIEGSMEAKNNGKQLLYTDFHPEQKNIGTKLANLTAGSGEITFPITTPGDLKRLRIGTFYRARDARDVFEVQVSFDDGKTYKTVDRLAGPYVGMGQYTVVNDVPANTRTAKVRFSGTQRNTLMLQNCRLDADYTEPNGGFRPVKVTYQWEENGQPKQDIRVIQKPTDTYTITCARKPVMKSITLELAP